MSDKTETSGEKTPKESAVTYRELNKKLWSLNRLLQSH